MRKTLIGLSILTIGFTSCSECKNESPRARVINNGTESVSVHIETSGGSTVNINNIDAGENSDFNEFAEGSVEFTISVGKGTVDYKKSFDMEECFEYDIEIDENNDITSKPTDRNE